MAQLPLIIWKGINYNAALTFWTPAKTQAAFEAYRASGHSLRREAISQNNRGLLDHIETLFGPYGEYLLSQGVEMVALTGQYPNGYWNQDTIATHFATYVKNGGDLDWHAFRVSDKHLFKAIVRHYGTLRAFYEDHGIDYRPHYRHTVWDKDVLVDWIHQWQAAGYALTAEAIRDNNEKVYQAILRHYGSLKQFYSELGINYAEISGRKYELYTEDEQFMEAWRTFAVTTDDWSAGNLCAYDHNLYAMLQRRFGGYPAFIAKMGYDYQTVSKN